MRENFFSIFVFSHYENVAVLSQQVRERSLNEDGKGSLTKMPDSRVTSRSIGHNRAFERLGLVGRYRGQVR
jgi:hypothetical protein